MAPGGIEPPRVDSKSTALSTELRGPAAMHGILCRRVVAVAQLVEPRVVIPVVAGSSPVRHPISMSGFSRTSGFELRGRKACLPVRNNPER